MKERWRMKEKRTDGSLIDSNQKQLELALRVASGVWLPNKTWRSGPAMIHRASETLKGHLTKLRKIFLGKHL